MADQYRPLDLSEKGKSREGEPVALDRRLFMQLHVFSGVASTGALVEALDGSGLDGVLYAALNDPRGIALLTWSEEPRHFTMEVRAFLGRAPFANLTPRPEFTMVGRTYAIGYERPLEKYLLELPRRKVTNPAWPWAIWYPLRRRGEFNRLPEERQFEMLREHGSIGRKFGAAELGYDIRLACYGLDQYDNDFVVGLVGPDLFPLSAIVQAMRATEQTATYIEKMGPFFVGNVIWSRDSDP